MFYRGSLYKRLIAIAPGLKRIDPSSLRFRLTVGITLVAFFGLGSLATWTGWRMQRVLVASHKQNEIVVAERFQEDVQLYSEMMPVAASLQKAIQNRSTSNLFIWVVDPQSRLVAQSQTLSTSQWQGAAKLRSASGVSAIPQVRRISGRSLILCASPLKIGGTTVGQAYVAVDITHDEGMFRSVIQSLGIASFLSVLVIAVVIAVYVHRSLRPLRQMSQIAGTVSADDLEQAQIHLDQAPSEVKELAQTLDTMLGRLSQSWEQQRQFVSNVSHELRTPLTIVHGYLQSILRRGDNLTDPQREALEVASSESARTIQLLQDLLDLARAESGFLQLHLEALSLNDLVLEVAGMAEQFSHQKIKIETGKSSIVVKADRNRLIQVLLNLIDNAVKYSPADQPITVTLDSLEKAARIQVSDRGCGIPLQQQARIFERFYRVDQARTRTSGGCGLGLAIVKTLVEEMGGSVTVRSQFGQGSTFSVMLPRQES